MPHASPSGLYVHIPFCRRHCPYCDFTIAVVETPPHLDYARALVAELDARRSEWTERTITTCYFGGGTPSLWSSDAIRHFADWVRPRLGALEEMTVEFNPEGVHKALVDDWVRAGTTRVSLGAQSLDPATLDWLGRKHSPESVRDAVAILKDAGIAHVSVDLIYGVPTRTNETLRRELAAILAMDLVDHVSAYELTWEPRTPLGAARRRGERSPVHEEAIVREYHEIHDTLTAAGFEHYEVSNYGRAGARGVHNAAYWTGVPYLGIGVGAHSMTRRADGGVRRTANVRSLKRYLRDGHSFDAVEEVSARGHAAELCMLGLRTEQGVDFEVLADRGVIPSPQRDALVDLATAWSRRGHGQRVGARFSPNHHGFLQSDTMAAEAMAVILDDER